MTRKASFLLGAIFTLALVVFAYIALEIYAMARRSQLMVFSNRIDLARIMENDVDTFWDLQPNMKNVEVPPQEGGPAITFHVSTNALALRNPPIAAKAGRFRILAIGDSTTFGQYVEDAEAWPAQLQQILDPAAKRVEVINAGLIGATSFQGLSYLLNRGFALEPDVVVATYGFNDRANWNGAADRLSLPLLDTLRVDGLFRPLLKGLVPDVAAPMKNATRVSDGEFLDVLLYMARFCEDRNAALFLNCWADPSQLSGPWDNLPNYTYQSLLFEAANRSKARIIDLRPHMHDAPQPVYVDSVHANAKGCRVAAETIAAYLRGAYPKELPLP